MLSMPGILKRKALLWRVALEANIDGATYLLSKVDTYVVVSQKGGERRC